MGETLFTRIFDVSMVAIGGQLLGRTNPQRARATLFKMNTRALISKSRHPSGHFQVPTSRYPKDSHGEGGHPAMLLACPDGDRQETQISRFQAAVRLAKQPQLPTPTATRLLGRSLFSHHIKLEIPHFAPILAAPTASQLSYTVPYTVPYIRHVRHLIGTGPI